jgi:ribosomal protein S5
MRENNNNERTQRKGVQVKRRFFQKEETQGPEISNIILDRRSVVTVTKGGKVRKTFAIFAVVVHHSKYKKEIGVGSSGGKSFAEAREKAIRNAKKRLIEFRMNKNQTLCHDVSASYHGTDVEIFHAKVGIKACPTARLMFKAMNFNATCKITSGSKNKLSISRAIVAALKNHESIFEIAERCGKTFDDIVNRKMCVKGGTANV